MLRNIGPDRVQPLRRHRRTRDLWARIDVELQVVHEIRRHARVLKDLPHARAQVERVPEAVHQQTLE